MTIIPRECDRLTTARGTRISMSRPSSQFRPVNYFVDWRKYPLRFRFGSVILILMTNRTKAVNVSMVSHNFGTRFQMPRDGRVFIEIASPVRIGPTFRKFEVYSVSDGMENFEGYARDALRVGLASALDLARN
jgi:hypothetical protein